MDDNENHSPVSWVPHDGHTRPSEGLNVLLVEDSPIIQRMAATILRSAGHAVLTASDGWEAMELFCRHLARIDLVVLDLLIPQLDGQAVMDQVRALRGEVPVLLTTGWSDHATLHRVRHDPFCRLLSKPYRADQLTSAVAGLAAG